VVWVYELQEIYQKRTETLVLCQELSSYGGCSKKYIPKFGYGPIDYCHLLLHSSFHSIIPPSEYFKLFRHIYALVP
jgi:hypothetical protein